MNGNDTYGPSPLKLEAFDNVESITGVIKNIITKPFDNGPRWIITVDDDWTLIGNDTNYRAVRKLYGAESEGWLKRPITAYKGMLRSRNGEKEGICLRVPEPAEDSSQQELTLPDDLPPPPNGEGAAVDNFRDDIPF